MIEHLPWDSDFFGFGVGKISLKDAVAAGHDSLRKAKTDHNITLIYIFNDLSEPADKGKREELIAALDARLVDTKVVFSKDFKDSDSPEFPENIAEYSNPDATGKLYSIALQSGVYSRYRLDKRFPEGSYERMYHLWLENSLNGLIADKVLVSLDDKNETTGLVTLSLKQSHATIGLIAVDENSRGQRAGQRLMQAAEWYALQAGKKRVNVATQLDNKSACRFYEKAGYEEVSRVEVFHFWD